MAAWQVDFYIVPRRALASRAELTPSVLEDIDWSATNSFPTDYPTRMAAIAAPARSLSADLQTWGREDGNRVDVWSDAGRVIRVMARVDVRRLDSKFGAALLEFVRKAGAVLVRSDGLVVEPIIAAYAAALRSSVAWRFANDPAAFWAAHSASDDDEK
jgi:hypothetical protein